MFREYHIDFVHRWYLLLLLVLPLLWWFSYGGLSGLGRVRRFLALSLRSIVFALLVFALAEMQFVRTSEDLTVTFLLDQSLSIPAELRRAMLEYYNRVVERYRADHPSDRAGAIVFGRTAEVEIPPFDDSVPLANTIESRLDPEHTNVAAAMRLAQATFPHDAAKRVVIVSDFNENLGDALSQGRGLAEAGVAIDVVPVRFSARGDVIVEKVTMPPDVRRGEDFYLGVVLNNTSQAGEDAAPISGRLRLSRKTGNQEEVLDETPVTIEPGKRVFTLQEKIEAPDFYTYQAQFIPDDPRADATPQNNRASAFTHVRGRGQVLLIEDYELPGKFNRLVEALRRADIEVVLRPSGPGEPFAGLPELQTFDSVLLGDVPREQFSEEQIKQLVINTQQLGSGLVMLGGPNSFGAGGWTNTDLEKAMPVDFQIKSGTVVPVGALVLLMHASEMGNGNYWQKVVAKEAIKALGPQDYSGLIHWNGTDQWLWNHPNGLIKIGSNRDGMLARIDRMTPGDMPAFDPSLVMADKAFRQATDAAVKHMIIISDGDPSPPSNRILSALTAQGVKITTVAIGSHGPAGSSLLQRIATASGGKYYQVTNPNQLPKIYQREARKVARPLIYENAEGFSPQIRYDHEMVKGIEQFQPPITGFVMTSVKDHPAVEVALVSPRPGQVQNSTILAGWHYGVGRTVAFTTDAGAQWAKSWPEWEGYDKLFSQVVRWSMRPVGDQGKFTVATELEDGKVRLVITALDKDDQFLNFLNMTGAVVGPDLKPVDVKIRQTAPGRYIGEFDTRESGSYLINLTPGAGMAPIRTGISVPYSAEFRDRGTNEALATSIVALRPAGAPVGTMIQTPDGAFDPARLEDVNPFRHDLPKATSNQDIWHLLVLSACCVFFGDVFVRRVALDFAWVAPLAVRLRDRVLGREAQPTAPVTMERLRSRKAAIAQEIEQRRAQVRFEPTAEARTDADVLREELSADSPPPQKPRASAGGQFAPEAEQESYTERLLKAKKQAREQRREQE